MLIITESVCFYLWHFEKGVFFFFFFQLGNILHLAPSGTVQERERDYHYHVPQTVTGSG